MFRHPPVSSKGRCCWVCGKPGGAGFTIALKLLGAEDILPGQIGYAHSDCLHDLREHLAAAEREHV